MELTSLDTHEKNANLVARNERRRTLSEVLAQQLLSRAWSMPANGLRGQLRLRVLRRLVAAVAGSGDPLVRYELDGTKLWLPASHALPFICRWMPQYSRNLARIAARCAEKDSDFTMLDIGANVGDTVALARHEAHFPILCVEASDKFFEILSLNVPSFRGDVELEHAMVAVTSGMVAGTLRAESGTAQFVSGEGTVRGRTLSDILSDHPRFVAPKMIKLDTDGMDCAILRSELRLLARAKPVLFFEYCPDLIATEAEALEVFRELASIGYGTMLVYENNGDYLVSAKAGDQRAVAELYAFYSGRGIERYCDICVFHEDEAELAETIRQSELGYFRRLRPLARPFTWMGPQMTTEEAILYLRSQPENEELMRNAYLDSDLGGCAERFAGSEEFRQVCGLLGERLRGATVLDVGAGTGIASYALARAGAAKVFALEPDPSMHIGRGAIVRLSDGLPISIVDGFCENIPLPDASVEIVYARQVLHHTRDLQQAIRECARVLKRGGVFVACREHVVHNADELGRFLREHPVHRLAGGEHAYRLHEYEEAIVGAGLRMERVIGPLTSVINAFPKVQSDEELKQHIRGVIQRQFGWAGKVASYFPGMVDWARAVLEKPQRVCRYTEAGSMYAFLARKGLSGAPR